MNLIDVTIRESTYMKRGFTHENVLGYLKTYKQFMRFKEIESLELCFLDNQNSGFFLYNPSLISSAYEILEGKYGLVAVLHPNSVDLNGWDSEIIKMFSSVRLMINSDMDYKSEKIITYLHELGVNVSVNVIYVSKKDFSFIDKCLGIAENNDVEVFTVADSSGHCLPGQIYEYIRHINEQKTNCRTNLHLHNHMGMALANALACKEHLDYLDCSINGYGKGGGNLELEKAVLALRLSSGEEISIKELEGFFEVYRYLVEKVTGDAWGPCVNKIKNMLIGFYDLNMNQISELESQVGDGVEEFCVELLKSYSRE